MAINDEVCMGLIRLLRSEQGESVTILCENEGDGPSKVVECLGEWTEWKDRRFGANDLLGALKLAAVARQEYLQKKFSTPEAEEQAEFDQEEHYYD